MRENKGMSAGREAAITKRKKHERNKVRRLGVMKAALINIFYIISD